MITSPKAIAEDYSHRVWNLKDMQAADELLDSKIVIHSLLGDHHGIEAMKKVISDWLTGLPDLSVTNKQVVSENNTVIIHWDAVGTHKGIFKNILPTHKKVAYSGVSIYTIAAGKISEYWGYLDMNYLLSQIQNSR